MRSLFADFARANGYELYVGRVDPKRPEFNVILQRKDSMIIAVNPFHESTYEVSLYSARDKPPSKQSLQSILAVLERSIDAQQVAP